MQFVRPHFIISVFQRCGKSQSAAVVLQAMRAYVAEAKFFGQRRDFVVFAYAEIAREVQTFYIVTIGEIKGSGKFVFTV